MLRNDENSVIEKVKKCKKREKENQKNLVDTVSDVQDVKNSSLGIKAPMVSLTCKADVLAKIVGVPLNRLGSVFKEYGITLKYITDFNEELFTPTDDCPTKSDRRPIVCLDSLNNTNDLTSELSLDCSCLTVDMYNAVMQEGFSSDYEDLSTEEQSVIDWFVARHYSSIARLIRVVTEDYRNGYFVKEITSDMLRRFILKNERVLNMRREAGIANSLDALERVVRRMAPYCTIFELSEFLHVKPKDMRAFIKQRGIECRVILDMTHLLLPKLMFSSTPEVGLYTLRNSFGMSFCEIFAFCNDNNITLVDVNGEVIDTSSSALIKLLESRASLMNIVEDSKTK